MGTKTRPPQHPLNQQIGGTHYAGFAVQPVELFHHNRVPFCKASAIKYLMRHGKKAAGRQDLEKAKHYLALLRSLGDPEPMDVEHFIHANRMKPFEGAILSHMLGDDPDYGGLIGDIQYLIHTEYG